MRNVKASMVMLLVVLSLLISACAVPAPAQPSADTGADGSDAAAAPMEIEFWTLLTGPLGARLDEMVQEFNDSQDEIVVRNINQGGYNELQQKLLAAVAADNVPAMTMVDYKFVPFYAQRGVFEPIGDLASEEDMQDFIPGLLTDLTFDGKVYALPFNRSTQGLFYNKDLFIDVGLDPNDPPETWEEVREYAMQLTDADQKQYGIYATGNMQWHFEPYVNQAGGAVSDENCNFTLDEEAAVAAAQYLQDLIYVDNVALIPSNLSGTFDQQAIEFITGRIGMMRHSTAIQGFIDDTVDFDWGFAMIPGGPGGRAVTGGGANIAISADASPEEKAAAWEFARWLTGPEQSAAWHMATGYMPSRFSVLDLPEVQAFHEENPSWLTSVEQLEFAVPTGCGVLNAPEWASVIEASMDRILINNEDVETVLREAELELQETIDQARADGDLIQP